MEYVALDSVRICDRCGSINILSNPPPSKAKEGDIIIYECMSCKIKSQSFPIIKKNNIRTFRSNVKGKFKGY